MSTLIIWPVWRIALVVVLSALLGGFVWNLILLIRGIIKDRRELDMILLDEAERDFRGCKGCKRNLGEDCCSLNAEVECIRSHYAMWEGEEDV